MNNYEIKSATVADDGNTLVTEVEMVFSDGSKKTISISHFRPADEAEVIQGIENRWQSEQDAITWAAHNKQIADALN